MTNFSQKNLLQLAQQNEDQGKFGQAIKNLEEALRNGHSPSIVAQLAKNYRQNKQEDQAYALLKEEPDLFSDSQLFQEYQLTLKANHFAIEAAQLEYLHGQKLPVQVRPSSEEDQQLLMRTFRQKENITQWDYQQLLKLNVVNFLNFAQSLLLDPSQNFALRLSLCEDLVKLGSTKPCKIWILDQIREFVPRESQLLEKETIYQEVIAAISDKLRHNPSQLPMYLGEVNLVLGSLYPRLGDYIEDPDAFSHDLYSFLQSRKGYEYQKLLEKVYQHLPH